MKRWVLWTLALALPFSGSAGTAHAGMCDNDERPAATLLLPYFEVDLQNPDGIDTVFSINNAYENALLAHVVLWSDMGVPVLNFNVYLTGFDVQTINLRDILNGMLPQTASAGQDPADTISPQGELSQDIDFPDCAGQLPLPPLPATLLDTVRKLLTGQASPLSGSCAGRNRGDQIARGYVTVDTVNNCTLSFPSDPVYFSGLATNQNNLFGDYTLINSSRGSAIGNPLVHIEAFDSGFTAGDYTFYGRYVGWNADDGREPLATTFGARVVSRASDLLVWRDSKVNQEQFKCQTLPPWVPLGQESLIAFDTEENPVVFTNSPFPLAAQRIRVDSNRLPIPHVDGWVYLNLNTIVVEAGDNPPYDSTAAQAWVSVVTRPDDGRLAVGYDARRYDSACTPNHSDPGGS